MQHSDLSLLDLLRDNAENGRIPFHMPGHKRASALFPYLNELSAAEDITEIDGFDNLHGASGILRQAMERAALLWHSQRSYFLIGGSSCGILAGIRALTRRGDKVLLSRNAHKSVYHAIELCGLHPVFLTPPYDRETGIFLSLPPAQLKEALSRHPDARLFILTSPTYEGILSDTAELTGIAHAQGTAVLVDEAHGAHLSLHPAFPDGAVSAGADIVVQSLHKTLPSLTQTAILHANGPFADPDRLAHQLAVFETSSPSYLLMASIDGCVRTLQNQPEILDRWADNLTEFRNSVQTLRRLRLPAQCGGIPGAFRWDPSKIYISTAKTDKTGTELAAILRAANLEPEMVASHGVLCMSGPGDTPHALAALSDVLHEADRLCSETSVPCGVPLPPLAVPVCSPEEALERAWEWVSPAQSIGRIAAEYIWAYPPGIPLFIP